MTYAIVSFVKIHRNLLRTIEYNLPRTIPVTLTFHVPHQITLKKNRKSHKPNVLRRRRILQLRRFLRQPQIWQFLE